MPGPSVLHAIADRVAAMPVPPRVPLPEQIVPLSGAHVDGYAEGHADAIKRVVKMLRWLADGEDEDMTAWVWVRNLVIPDRSRLVLRQVHAQARAEGTMPDFFAMPDLQGTVHGTLYVPMPRWLAKESKVPFKTERPENAFDPPLLRRE